MKRISYFIILVFLFFGILYSCKSTDPLVKQRQIEEFDGKIAGERYTFTARHAYPMSGRNITLTSEYTLKITPDTITAYLPYFGRAYTAPAPSDEGGIKFVSTDFDYKISEKQKGIYRVSVEIKDHPNNYRLSMLIGENGWGSLHVNQRDKQSISFEGVID